MVVVENVVIIYYASANQTRLGTTVKGIMAPNLKIKSDQDMILCWIHSGASESGYEGISEVAKHGGATIPTLIRVSHIHLFWIAFILFFIGKIFLLCEMNVYLKRVAMIVPFASMLLDVLSWFITKTIPEFAYVVIASGALMGFSMGMQILLSIYPMWMPRYQK